MELRHLRYFVSVADTLNFTQAAQRLSVTQPSLSQQIKLLEQEVGVQLIHRATQSVQLTAEGQAFLIHAQQALHSAQLAIQAAQQVAQQKQHQLRIGLLNVAELKLLPVILQRLKQQLPDLKLHIESLTCLEQIQKLKHGELDICFNRYALPDPAYSNVKLLEEAVYLVASEKLHPFQHTVSQDWLLQQSLIFCDAQASPVFYEKIQQHFPLQRLPAQQRIEVTNVLQHLNFINLGLGYSFLPEYALKFLNPDIQIIATQFQLPNLALYANYANAPAHQALQLLINELENIRL